MRTWLVPVRITRTARCPEGFYLLVNDSRIRFATKKLAVAAIHYVLAVQKIQVVSVREFAARKKQRLKVPTAQEKAPIHRPLPA